MLDITTTFIFIEAITAVNTISVLLLWWTHRNVRGLAAISAGSICLIAAFALMGVRTPHFITGSNTAMTLAIGLVADGMVVLVQGKSRRWLVYGFAAFTAIFWEITQWLDPNNVAIRVTTATLMYFIFYGFLLVEIIRSRSQISAARIGMIFTLVAHMIVLLARTLVSTLHPDSSFIFSSDIQSWFLLESAVAMNLTFIFIMIIIGAQLDAALKQQTLSLASERHLHTQLRQFLSMLGHEFRTPLSIIDRSAEMSLELLESSHQPIKRRLTTIRSTTDRLRGLMDNLLMAERAELEVLDANAVDITRLVQDLIRLLAHKYDEQRLFATLQAGPTLVKGNREMLAAAISNLLDNGLKYSPPDQPVHITVRTGDNNSIVMIICDHGIGFPEHQINQIGRRFFRAENAQAIQGTGLGLSIVRTIIDKHHGQVTFCNGADGGAVVTVTLPALTLPA